MTTDPFAVLGIAPTQDLGTVKRAYFTLLPTHPPETDPQGFRLLRDAYEQLSSLRGLNAAFAAAPVDLAAAERDYSTRFDARIEQHARTVSRRQLSGVAVQRFVEQFSVKTWDELLATDLRQE